MTKQLIDSDLEAIHGGAIDFRLDRPAFARSRRADRVGEDPGNGGRGPTPETSATHSDTTGLAARW